MAVAAYAQITGDEDGFYPADHCRAQHGESDGETHGLDERFDFDNAQEMHQPLTRLAALSLKETPR